ncbi:hypothetical protein Tco_1221342 [Tanacetum coccineum]
MSTSSAVTYTSISSEARSWSIPNEDPYEEAARQALEQALPFPDYVPDPIELEDHVPVYIPKLVYPEYLAPSDDEIPIEDQPLPADALPIALSPGYISNSDPEEDEEDPTDEGDNNDNESFDDEDDAVKEDEEDEEHLSPTDSIVVASPAIDHAPSAKETKPFETDEFAATPPPPLAYRITSRMFVRPQTPIPFPSEEVVARLLALPTPPPSPLTVLSSPLPQILSPPMSSPLPPPFLPSPIRPPYTRAAMTQMRAAVPSTYHLLLPARTPPLLPIPLHAPSTCCKDDILEADMSL